MKRKGLRVNHRKPKRSKSTTKRGHSRSHRYTPQKLAVIEREYEQARRRYRLLGCQLYTARSKGAR